MTKTLTPRLLGELSEHAPEHVVESMQDALLDPNAERFEGERATLSDFLLVDVLEGGEAGDAVRDLAFAAMRCADLGAMRAATALAIRRRAGGSRHGA